MPAMPRLSRLEPFVLLTPLAFSLFVVAQQRSEPVLKSFDTPRYPPLARQARIQGEVRLEFFVNHNGDVVAVNLLSGHPMLAPAATETVKTWKFQFPKNSPLDDQRYETVFEFDIATEVLELPTGNNAKIVTDSFHHVRIITTAPSFSDAQASACPSGKEKLPPSESSAADFVEMSRSGCYGTCPVYTVRVHASGDVDWDGGRFVDDRARGKANISPASARELISQFARPEFWALCASYSQSITDSATTRFRVHIGDRTKSVSNYANSAPKSLEQLEYAIDEAADTHQWRHGDPHDEPLTRIGDDASMPKPGVTLLMRAAAFGDAKKVKALLKEGADATQADSSGWTPMMYATISGYGEGGVHIVHSDIVGLLLAAGASPNQSSLRGDTPLMAAAVDRRFDETLVRAGADVNAQDLEGVSTLMILASFGAADQIDAALKSGAKTSLKDAHGRTALDYLRLANCGKNPLRDEIQVTDGEGGECNHLDEEDFQKAEKRLEGAMQLASP
jgi:TonB family protein